MECIAKTLSKYIDNTETSIKLEYNDQNHWHLHLTKHRAKLLKKKFSNLSSRQNFI